MTTMAVPAGKLETAEGPVATGPGVVNGPSVEPLDWQSIDWSAVEESVRRLRQRIFTASRAGDLKRVRSLQKLMLRSRANALLSVRRVTEVNAGRLTAGIDGQVVTDPQTKAGLAHWVQHESAPWQARPVRRVSIPKADGKQRPLGIPVLADRALQGLVVNTLEPEWEVRFEPKTYGFRPGRGCQDAIGAIYQAARGPRAKRLWALDADLRAAFDRIDHEHLLSSLGGFPARNTVAGWLKAGVVDKGRWSPTEGGTPQGGVVSPLLQNIALHGMEHAAGVRYRHLRSSIEVVTGHPLVVRHADDFVVLCHSRGQAEQVKARLVDWLTPRGLAFNEDKTRIVHLEDGFDFLGFNVRRYRGKLLIKPSKAAIRRIRHSSPSPHDRVDRADHVPGWGTSQGSHLRAQWQLTFKWATRRHPTKMKGWVASRYFGQFHPHIKSRWIFGDRDSGAFMHRFRWTRIIRHQMVIGQASIDDPALTDYWAARRRRNRSSLPISRTALHLMKVQDGRCPRCDDLLLHADRAPDDPDQWESWLKGIRKAIARQAIVPVTSGWNYQQRLLHSHCHRRRTSTVTGTSTATNPPP